MSRTNILRENSGALLANESNIRMARSEISDTCLLRPGYKSFKSMLTNRQVFNSSLLSAIPELPTTKVDDELTDVILRFRNPTTERK